MSAHIQRNVVKVLCVFSAVLLFAGLANLSHAQSSASGQTHVIGGSQVFCETTMRGKALVVLCSTDQATHLVIVQQGDKLIAFPLTQFGVQINQAAYGYRQGKANGIADPEELLAQLGLGQAAG